MPRLVMDAEKARRDRMLRVWDSMSATKGTQSSEVRDRLTEEEDAHYISKKVGIIKGNSILDVCCGNGALTSKFAECSGITAGLDFSEKMITLAKHHNGRASNVLLLRGLAESLPFKDNSWDRVLCLCALHYLPSEGSARRVVEEMIRVTKKDGAILITDVPSVNSWAYKVWNIIRNRKDSIDYDIPSAEISGLLKKIVNRLRLLFRRFYRRRVVSDGWLWLSPDFFTENFIDGKCNNVNVYKSRKRRRYEINYRFDILISKVGK